jgi:glycosyltransferase involved in cell wall biosynthesis
MVPGQKVIVVMPAFNAAHTIARTLGAVPPGWVDHTLVVDDGSDDGTAAVARSLGVEVVEHAANRGYGGAQKTGYRRALDGGADIVVLLHSDYQYDPALLPDFVRPIAGGDVDGLTGSRIKSGDALKGGMPLWKYVPNRVLTFLGNLTFGTAVSEFHNGYRAYSRRALEAVPFSSFSDRFDFDTQIILHLAARGFRLGEVPSPTRFAKDSSMMSFRQGVVYGLSLLGHMLRHALHRLRIRRDPALPS